VRAVLAAALLVTITACSEPDAPSEPASPSVTASAAPSPTAEDRVESPDAATTAPSLPVPEGVELTAQGSELRVGDTATVAWEPRTNVVGVLEVTVTRLEQVPIKALAAYRLDPVQRKSSLFYVRATVTNAGATNLAGVAVPLYLLDDRNTLIQATPFAAPYRPCPSKPLPKPFAPGDRVRVCLVYLVPEQGRLEAVSFRPTQEYDPITWTGEIRTPKPPGRRTTADSG
jgi:hypothetical protein